ncbi:hypothetical protein F3Y22_tig00111086pilonHSYRG00033 [Hibiscus syriacus]|uniref:Uncharacterized protein n=1 Tax=Hibiscus syriacus TaxID=106335 RepID=A0A6A2Z2B2_HIBSY|nr:hypothetical protein F3Y22_tig00111086pilonHSYRG00033 [Hibiscus syriacus]
MRASNSAWNVGPGILLPSLAITFRYACGNGTMTDQETLMTRALAESRMEFENSNYGMVGASESSVKKMVKKVKVEDGEGGDCMVCLEELRLVSKHPGCHVLISFMAAASKMVEAESLLPYLSIVKSMLEISLKLQRKSLQNVSQTEGGLSQAYVIFVKIIWNNEHSTNEC